MGFSQSPMFKLASTIGWPVTTLQKEELIKWEGGEKQQFSWIQRSQLWWFGTQIRMPPHAWGRPTTCWKDDIAFLEWKCLGIPQNELCSVTGEKDMWVSFLDLLMADLGYKIKRMKVLIFHH